MSVRTFSRRFRSQIGLSPKQYAEIIRLNRVCSDLVHPGKHDLLTIALHHGYYDASHLINAFKNYLHLTPSEFTTQLLKDGDYTGKFTLLDPATSK
jgi:transcriptional regulator GlxA family with amidase domain